MHTHKCFTVQRNEEKSHTYALLGNINNTDDEKQMSIPTNYEETKQTTKHANV